MGVNFPFWLREFRGFGTAPIIASLSSSSLWFFCIILLSYGPRDWSARALLCICDQNTPNFRSLVLAALNLLWFMLMFILMSFSVALCLIPSKIFLFAHMSVTSLCGQPMSRSSSWFWICEAPSPWKVKICWTRCWRDWWLFTRSVSPHNYERMFF